MSIVDQESASYFVISSDGSAVYFLDDISDAGYGDLYKITMIDSQAGTPEQYDYDVSYRSFDLDSKGDIIYYKNVNENSSEGDLYINGKEIDYDVCLYDTVFLDDAVLYYTDWNNEKSYGTLKMFKNGTKTKIADDVHEYDIIDNGDILYLYDYSMNYYTGTLYLFNGGDPKKIDDDVTALIPSHDYETKGDYYGW